MDVEPIISVESFGAFDVLAITWEGAEIKFVMFDDERLDGPVSGMTAPGSTSLWRVPHDPLADLFIVAEGPDGQELDHLRQGIHHLGGARTSYVRLELDAQPSGGTINAWGTYLWPTLKLVWSARECADWALPSDLLDANLKVRRPDRLAVVRPLHAKDSFVVNIIDQLYRIADKAEIDWKRDHGGGEIPQEELHDILRSEGAGLGCLTETGRVRLLEALDRVRTDGGRTLETVRLAHGEQQANEAYRTWQTVAPALVAMTLTPQDIREAGLAPTGNELKLSAFIMCDDDTLTIDGVPESVALDVMLPDGTLCPADLARVVVRGGGVTWSSHDGNVAEYRFARRAAALPRAWATSAVQLLDEAGFSLSQHLAEDARRFEGVADIPGWLAAAAGPASDAFEHFGDRAGLVDAGFWSQSGLPDAIVRRTLMHLVEITIARSAAGTLEQLSQISGFDQDGTAYAALLRVDAGLSGDSRYDSTVRGAARKFHVQTSEGDDGRRAALFLSVGAFGEEGIAFVDALAGGNDHAALKIACRDLGLSEGPRLVAT